MDPIQRLARRLRSVEKLAFRAATQPQLAHSSIEDGAIQSMQDGTLKVVVGKQYDGTQAVAAFNGPTPPTPSAPGAAPALEGAVISWDGLFADGSVVPMDFARIEVHVSSDPDFTAEFAETLRATFETPRGAEVFVSLPAGPHYARLVTRSLSGGRSAASAVTPVTPQALSDALPPPTDGVAPASSPTPVLSGGIGSLFVTWLPVANPDPVVYEIHASPVPGFTPGPGTLVEAKATGGQYVIRRLPGSELPISYTNSTYVQIIAKDADGAAAPGPEASAMAVQVNNSDIAVSAITADKIKSNEVTADKLASTIVLSSIIATGSAGQDRVILDTSGIQVLKADNSQRASFPTDSSQPVFVKGTAELDAVVINDKMTVRGTNNALVPGTNLQLQGSVKNPQSTVSVTTDWDSVQTWADLTQYSYMIRGATLDTANTYTYANLFFGTQLMAFNENGTFASSIGLPDNPIGAGYSGTHQAYGGMVKVGSYYFTLGTMHRDTDNVDVWQLRKWSINWATNTVTFVAHSDLGIDGSAFRTSPTDPYPILGKGGATGLVVAWWAKPSNYYLTSLSIDTTTLSFSAYSNVYYGDPVTSTADIGDMLYFEQGSFDYGSTRSIFAYKVGGQQVTRVFNGTTRSPQDEFKLPGGTVGMVYNATTTSSFRSLQSTGSRLFNVRHSLFNWSDTPNTWDTWWGSFTYRNSANAYETAQSLYKSFTLEKRMRLTMTAPAIPPSNGPTDPDSVNLWIGKGTSQPGRTAMWTFANPAVGAVTATKYSQTLGAPNTNPPGVNNFPASAISKITAADGSTMLDSTGLLKGAVLDTPKVKSNSDGSGQAGPIAWNAAGGFTSLPVRLAGATSLTASNTTAAGTWVFETANGLTCTFIAPTGGRVKISIAALLSTNAAGIREEWGLAWSGAATRDPLDSEVLAIYGGSSSTLSQNGLTYEVSGLTPGSTYTLTSKIRSQTGASASMGVGNRRVLVEVSL